MTIDAALQQCSMFYGLSSMVRIGNGVGLDMEAEHERQHHWHIERHVQRDHVYDGPSRV